MPVPPTPAHRRAQFRSQRPGTVPGTAVQKLMLMAGKAGPVWRGRSVSEANRRQCKYIRRGKQPVGWGRERLCCKPDFSHFHRSIIRIPLQHTQHLRIRTRARHVAVSWGLHDGTRRGCLTRVSAVFWPCAPPSCGQLFLGCANQLRGPRYVVCLFAGPCQRKQAGATIFQRVPAAVARRSGRGAAGANPPEQRVRGRRDLGCAHHLRERPARR